MSVDGIYIYISYSSSWLLAFCLPQIISVIFSYWTKCLCYWSTSCFHCAHVACLFCVHSFISCIKKTWYLQNSCREDVTGCLTAEDFTVLVLSKKVITVGYHLVIVVLICLWKWCYADFGVVFCWLVVAEQWTQRNIGEFHVLWCLWSHVYTCAYLCGQFCSCVSDVIVCYTDFLLVGTEMASHLAGVWTVKI